MKILEYIGLDVSGVKTAYRRVADAIGRDDFRAAQVKKLSNLSHGKFYRAKLDDADRLLFSLVRHGDEVYALMLEVISNHAYEKSRFLRGVTVDEGRIPDWDMAEAKAEAQVVRYLHSERVAVHLLDKPISFDDAQDAIYRQPPPLIVVGSAGSGKTALTLEKLKQTEGEVLYVTRSAFLAQSARNLYYANGYEKSGQEAQFLSYREFIESIHVPEGREATWRDFAAWFGRMRQSFKDIDGHQAFEEIRGVIGATATGALTRQQYLALGVRQSIFPAEQRPALYDLFEKYRLWLAEAKLFDLNLVAAAWQERAAVRYDFVVIDEVQDITAIELALVLRTLKQPGHFLLCGDSNQIVHPNFFSWSQVKSLFWSDPRLAERQELRVLTANFRNGRETTRVANQLLKIKHRRFGSIDRESNFLVQAVGADAGQVALMPDKDAAKKELNQKIRQSTQFAVLVMRDEDKAAARQHFSSPLLFSIHEAKGLEYENIVLYRFVSDHRVEFAEITDGVNASDLVGNDLDYRRAKDKSDKSLEIYKFFVNALYVALTRAIKNIYIIESDTDHSLFKLLDVRMDGGVKVEARQSSLEDWQKEARKLELQGKQEQAEAIRRDILKITPVPWPVFDQSRITALLVKVFREQALGNKHKQQLYDVTLCYNEVNLAAWMIQETGFEPARKFYQHYPSQARKTYLPYFGKNFKEVLRQCEQYGLEHRQIMNQTPLMAAAASGNVALVEALLERGASVDAVDHFGCNALHWAMQEAFQDIQFAQGPFAVLYELLAPASVDVNTGDRLVRIDRHLSEYFLLQTMWALFRSRFTQRYRRPDAAFATQAILDAWEHIPSNVVSPGRNKRQHLSNVLSRNEVARDYAYNRALFWRVTQGWYQFNPKLSVRVQSPHGEAWVPVYQALNLAFVAEFAAGSEREIMRDRLNGYLSAAGLPAAPVPMAVERTVARELAAQQAREATARELAHKAEQEAKARLAQAQQRGPKAVTLPAQPPEPKWGTPEAKRLAIERLRKKTADKSGS